MSSLTKLLFLAAASYFSINQPVLADAVEPDLNALVAKVIDECKVSKSYFSVADDQLLFTPAHDAEFEKIDCVLTHLKDAKVPRIVFIGNEWDPNAVLESSLHYIVVASKSEIDALMTSAEFKHWQIEKLATDDDGTRFLIFETKTGVTAGQSSILLDRIWSQDFGDVSFGLAPSKLNDNGKDE